MGMFAPEIVLWCSISQLSEAKVVRDKITAVWRKRWGLPVPPRVGFWNRCWENLKRRFGSAVPEIIRATKLVWR
jgi:hypothetical protein